MKKPLTSLLLTTIAMFIIFSCTKDSGSGNNNGSGGNGGGGGATTGQVIFWTSSDFGCGNITVVCNGISRQITGYYSSGTPDCGDTYGANFTLNPGSYNFTAACSGGNSWSGNITIAAGICSKMQLTGGTGGGGGTGISAMFWASDLGCGPITVNFYGQQKQITASSTSAPSCGTNGFATFDNLPYIITGYTASCSSLSWSGSVSTTPGTCTKIQLTRANATGGGGGGGGTCAGLLTGYGTVTSISSPYGAWSSWSKVANVGNGAVYISFYLNGCSGGYVIGYPKYRIQNTCTNGGNCFLSFKFEYADCAGVRHLEYVSSLALNSSYIMQNSGMWFLGKNITQSFVPSTVTVN